MTSQGNEERIRRAAEELEKQWETAPRWSGVERNYSPEEVVRLRGSFTVEHTIARRGAERLWDLVNTEDYVAALGCLTGGQAVESVKAGLRAIYLSGWQVAADANLAGQTYPDQSLYPANSVPLVVKRINNALQRADQINSKGGYLRNLTERARNEQFSVWPMLMALLRARMDAQAAAIAAGAASEGRRSGRRTEGTEPEAQISDALRQSMKKKGWDR